MQHLKDTTKRSKSAQTNATKRMIGLRLHTDEFTEVEEMARKQDRSVASFARICLRLGIEQLQKQKTDEV